MHFITGLSKTQLNKVVLLSCIAGVPITKVDFNRLDIRNSPNYYFGHMKAIKIESTNNNKVIHLIHTVVRVKLRDKFLDYLRSKLKFALETFDY